jgi:PQQ-like domain
LTVRTGIASPCVTASLRLKVAALALAAVCASALAACSSGPVSTGPATTRPPARSTTSTSSPKSASSTTTTTSTPPTSVAPSLASVAWTTSVAGAVYAQPVVSGDQVFVATEDNDVYALSRTTGQV